MKDLSPTAAPRRADRHAGLFEGEDGAWRCAWCRATPLYRATTTRNGAFRSTDDTRLFEKLCLEGFQAGLSWLTILNKREAFRHGFAGFDAERVARFDDARRRRACSAMPASCAIAARSNRRSTTRAA